MNGTIPNPKRDLLVRAKAAEFLSDRKEANVPDALFAACTDSALDVRRMSLQSFESVSGYPSRDVFGCGAAKEWWKNNKAEMLKKLNGSQQSK
jgi:hypothetical protein